MDLVATLKNDLNLNLSFIMHVEVIENLRPYWDIINTPAYQMSPLIFYESVARKYAYHILENIGKRKT